METLDYQLLPAQRRLIHCDIDVTLDIAIYQGGFGSGKTWAGSLLGILLAQSYPGSLGLVVAKTYPMVRDTTLRMYLEHLDRLGFEEGRDFQFLKSEAKLIFPCFGNSEILFRHLETPEVVKSLSVAWIQAEECSQLTEADFLMLLSRLRQPVKRLRFFGHTNPQPQKNWIWKYFVEKNKGKQTIQTETGRDVVMQYRRILAPTTDNTYLPPGYVDNMANQFDPTYYRMNVLGEDGDYRDGLVCPNWSLANLDKALAYNPDLPLYLSCDFNVDPMCWVMAHRVTLPNQPAGYEFIDELAIENTNIIQCAEEFARRYQHHKAGIIVTGDATGKSRADTASNPNDTKYKILLRALSDCGLTNVHLDLATSNPHTDIRVETWNGLVCNRDGVRRIKINPDRCPKLHWNLENLKYISGTSIIWEPSPKQIEQDTTHTIKFTKHPFDAASYLTHRYDPIRASVQTHKPIKLSLCPFYKS